MIRTPLSFKYMRAIFVLPSPLMAADEIRSLVLATQSRIQLTHAVYVCSGQALFQYQAELPEFSLQDEEMVLEHLPSDVVFHLQGADQYFRSNVDGLGRLHLYLNGDVPRHDQFAAALRALEDVQPISRTSLKEKLLYMKPSKTGVLFLTVDPLPCKLHLRNLYLIALKKFEGVGEVHVAAPAGLEVTVKSILPEAHFVNCDEALQSENYGVYAVAAGYNDYNQINFPFDRQSWSRKFVYAATPPPEFNRLYFDKSGNIHPVIENNKADDHIFARLASASPRAFLSYFPHGHYSLGTVGLGPTNEFGLRIHEELGDLADRPSKHKVIAVFGGSAVWGVSSYYTDCFSYLLERMLNEAFRRKGYKFTVLNFGLSGQILLDMMMTYLTFCQPLSPDIVISHDGQNDTVHGQMADPHLLNTYRHNYMIQLELWGQTLMDAMDTPLSQPGLGSAPGKEGFEELRPLNTPPQVIRMYTYRKKQFYDMVRAQGGEFIWGLQPAAFGNRQPGAMGKRLNDEEQEAHNVIFDNHPFSPEIMEGLDHIYKQLTDRLPDALPSDAHFINFHKIFAETAQDETLFYDHVHLAPDGEQLIAEGYFQKIRSDILPRWEVER